MTRRPKGFLIGANRFGEVVVVCGVIVAVAVLVALIMSLVQTVHDVGQAMGEALQVGSEEPTAVQA